MAVQSLNFQSGYDQLMAEIALLKCSQGADDAIESPFTLTANCEISALEAVAEQIAKPDNRLKLEFGNTCSVNVEHRLQTISEDAFRKVVWECVRRLERFGYFPFIEYAGRLCGARIRLSLVSPTGLDWVSYEAQKRLGLFDTIDSDY